MLTDGFISLHRSLLNWEWYDNINTKTLFIHLLLTVNWYDEKWRGIEIKRGQRLTSVAKLSSETSLSIQNIRTALTNLVSTNEITIKTTTKNSIITVLQYDFYQTVTNKTTSEVTSELTDNQQRANKELTKSQQLINNTNKANKTNKANNLINSAPTKKKKNVPNKATKKEKYENIFLSGSQDNIKLTPEEYKKLVDKHGEDTTKKAIEHLSLYIADRGDKSKSPTHYLTIIRWVIDAVQEREKYKKPNQPKSTLASETKYEPFKPANIGNFKQRQYTEEQLEALIN